MKKELCGRQLSTWQNHGELSFGFYEFTFARFGLLSAGSIPGSDIFILV
jgi:hypothetical protein